MKNRNAKASKLKRTIIMLSAKRCGSTAIFRMFQKHPDVRICHIDQKIRNWEFRFWDLAGQALQGEVKPFIERLQRALPFLKIPAILSEDIIFQLWDAVLDHFGPIVFDKSPQYLGDKLALDLLYKYQELGNDIRIFAFIRDPRDAITSQYTLWKNLVINDSPKKREKEWLKQYKHLEELEKKFDIIPLFRYEDFSHYPSCYAPILFKLCGLKNYSYTYNHIKPLNLGRYSISSDPEIRKWKMSEEFKCHLEKYGYPLIQDVKLKTIENIEVSYKKVRARIIGKVKNLFK